MNILFYEEDGNGNILVRLNQEMKLYFQSIPKWTSTYCISNEEYVRYYV